MKHVFDGVVADLQHPHVGRTNGHIYIRLTTERSADPEPKFSAGTPDAMVSVRIGTLASKRWHIGDMVIVTIEGGEESRG